VRSSLLLLLVLCAPTAARAQPAETQALRDASARLAAGDAAGAIDVLERARGEAPSDRLELNLATARAAHGQVVRAARALRRLAESSRDPLVREAAREQLDRLAPRVATLVLPASPPTEWTRLTVDGRPARAGQRVLVEPGAHVVEASDLDGAVLASASVEVEPGATRDVELRASAPSPGAPARPPVAQRRSRSAPAPAAAAATTAPSPAAVAANAPSPARSREPETRSRVELAAVTMPEPSEGDDEVDEAVWWAVGGAATAAVLSAIVIGVAVSASDDGSIAPGDAPPIFVGGMR